MWRAEKAELSNLLFAMRKMQSRLFCTRIEEMMKSDGARLFLDVSEKGPTINGLIKKLF